MVKNELQCLQEVKRRQFFCAQKDKELLDQKGIKITRDKEGNLLEIKRVEKGAQGHVQGPFGLHYKKDPYVSCGASIKFDSNGKVTEIGQLYSLRHEEIDEDLHMFLWKSYYRNYRRYDSDGNITGEYKSSPKEEFTSWATLDKEIAAVLKKEGMLESVRAALNSKKVVSSKGKIKTTRRCKERE